MSKFPIDKCPLCGKELIKIRGIGFIDNQCPVNITLDRADPITHYQVEDQSIGGVDIQHIIIGNFAIETFSVSGKSAIYKWKPEYVGKSTKVGNWIFVMETPQIHTDEPHKMLTRIQTLVPFA